MESALSLSAGRTRFHSRVVGHANSVQTPGFHQGAAKARRGWTKPAVLPAEMRCVRPGIGQTGRGQNQQPQSQDPSPIPSSPARKLGWAAFLGLAPATHRLGPWLDEAASINLMAVSCMGDGHRPIGQGSLPTSSPGPSPPHHGLSSARVSPR